MPDLHLEHLTKQYGTGPRAVCALDDISLHVADGELLTVVGPSGCGKSTLLRSIAGLETPELGAMRLGERDLTPLPPRKRNVAMVFQDLGLYSHLSVRENLAFPLRRSGTNREAIAEAVAWAAELVGIGESLARRPDQLSGGQQQRVALGRALVRRPDCFLFDEPLSSLEPSLRQALRQEIQRLQRTLQATTLFVTHDQEEALALGDRVAVMRAGRLLQIGTPQEVYLRPATQFVATFIGAPAMNMFRAEAVEHHGQTALQLLGGRLRPPDDWQATLRAHRGATLHVGMRPTDLTLDPPAGHADQSAWSIPAEVVDCQWLGADCDLMLRATEGESIALRTAGAVRFNTGQRVTVECNWSEVHLFDADGLRIEWTVDRSAPRANH